MDWPTNVPWKLVSFLAASIISLFALRYARKARFEPIPSLELEHARAKFLHAEGRYIVETQLTVTNTSGVPALIKQILINGITPMNEVITLPNPDAFAHDSRKALTVASRFRPRMLTPGVVLKPGEKNAVMAILFFEKRPDVVEVAIHTPGRKPFRIVTTDVKEVTMDSILDFL